MRALIFVLAAALLAGCTFSGTAKIDQNLTGNQSVNVTQPSQPSAPTQPSQPVANQTQPAGCSFSGKWNSEWGEMNLVQNGTSVTGTYTFDDGRINGTVSGKTLDGWWSENSDEDAYLPPNNAGNVQLNLSDDCNSLEGAWRYGSEGEMTGGWSGTRE